MPLNFPHGAAVRIEQLDADPYPVYEQLRRYEPVSWIAPLSMYYVVGYEHVRTILRDDQIFVVGTEQSTIFDTFGEHMLTVEGDLHSRLRRAHLKPFLRGTIRSRLENRIRDHADRLIDGFVDSGHVELRAAFASRLPVLTTLSLFGVAQEEEITLREWYDSFEAALANFRWDAGIRATAKRNVRDFHDLVQSGVERCRVSSAVDETLLSELANGGGKFQLRDDEIRRNASIVFFGGISTVEALMLNAVYALARHPGILEKVRGDPSLIPLAIEETMRWLSPVQSATRHVARDVVFHGVPLRAGDTVNCMLGAANRDPAEFEHPERFVLGRPNASRHLGFAVGVHSCLGLHLARTEVRIALEQLFARLSEWRVDWSASEEPSGYEFRQPRRLTLTW